MENVRHVHTTNDGIKLWIGSSRDGVGVHRLERFEMDLLEEAADNGFRPLYQQPRLYYDDDLFVDDQHLWSALHAGVRIINDVLPPEWHIIARPPSGDEITEPDRPWYSEIYVNIEPTWRVAHNCGTSAVACATSSSKYDDEYTDEAEIWIPDDFSTSDWNYSRTVIVHELLHALGIWGHVDSVEFPDSTLGTAGKTIPNFGYILSDIDREILQILYTSHERTDSDHYNDWGEWSDTAHHLMGEAEDGQMAYGAVLFNGIPMVWATGIQPDETLADNRSLRGSVTWNGTLLAWSGVSPLIGDTALTIDIGEFDDDVYQEHELSFSDIAYLNRFESAPTDPDKWFETRNVSIPVVVIGNAIHTALNAGIDHGYVTGQFMGAEHEHAAGTVKRTDFYGAFGASRD